jgi:hypothetical protein
MQKRELIMHISSQFTIFVVFVFIFISHLRLVGEEHFDSFDSEMIQDVTLVVKAFTEGAREAWDFTAPVLRHKDKSITYLVHLASVGEEKSKVAAIEILGYLKDERLIFLFLGYLNNSNAAIRYQAAKNIRLLGTKGATALPVLLQLKENPAWKDIHFKWILDETIISVQRKDDDHAP